MKITRIRPLVFEDRYVIVRVETDEGLTGLGECSPMDARQVVTALTHSLAPLAVGLNPLDIETLWETLAVGTYKVEGRLQMMALSGIEIACWDLKGKALGIPVHQLLGGRYRERVRMYATMDRDTPENMARHAERCLAAGYTAVKVKVATRQGFDARPDSTLECARAVREAIGPERDMLMDANSAWSPPNAVRMCQALERFDVWHLEQPVPERDLEALVYVNQRTTIPITFGEEDYSLWRYKEAIVRGACEVVQADPVKTGGMLVCQKVAHLAEAFSKALTPHNTSVHVGMAAHPAPGGGLAGGQGPAGVPPPAGGAGRPAARATRAAGRALQAGRGWLPGGPHGARPGRGAGREDRQTLRGGGTVGMNRRRLGGRWRLRWGARAAWRPAARRGRRRSRRARRAARRWSSTGG